LVANCLLSGLIDWAFTQKVPILTHFALFHDMLTEANSSKAFTKCCLRFVENF
jgi:hypothetical protein